MADMVRLRVDGFKANEVYLIDCSICGPLGVCLNYAYGVAAVRAHIYEHGAQLLPDNSQGAPQ